MKKVVKNSCYGGFNLSPKALKRYAELKGKEIYFFDIDWKNKESRYIPITPEEAEGKLFISYYTVPNPEEYKLYEIGVDGTYKDANKRAEEIHIEIESRDDPDLVKVVEELGDAAGGRFSQLEVVEIPDDVEFVIDEYDGLETIREKHRSW